MTTDGDRRPEVSIGHRIRQTRKRAKLTLKELGQKTGLSHSYLSEVETGRTALSISNLYKVAEALETPPQHFLVSEDQSQISIVRADEGRLPDVKPTTRVLVRGSHHAIEALEYMLEPNEDTGTFTHAGEEFVTVLGGTMRVNVGDEVIESVRAGDSLCYPGTLPHSWRVTSDEPLRVLLLITNERAPNENHL